MLYATTSNIKRKFNYASKITNFTLNTNTLLGKKLRYKYVKSDMNLSPNDISFIKMFKVIKHIFYEN